MDAVTARAVLHYVLDGGCRIAAAGAAPLDPAGGELVLLPAATRHRISPLPVAGAAPAPDGPPAPPDGRPAPPDVPAPDGHPAPPGHPAPTDLPGMPGPTSPLGPAVRILALDGPGPPARLLSLRTGYDRRTVRPLVSALPRAVLLDRRRVEGAPLLRDTLRLLAAPGRRAGPGDRLLALRVFEAALALAAAAPRPSEAGYPHPGIGRSVAAIETRYAEPWTVDTLAREAGMSRSSFTAAFREAVGTSPARHLTARRIREAARLLAETGLPQSAVPARVGYRSRVGFHLAFRTAYGTTPGEYRAASPRRDRRPLRRL
ncbi:AraC family transcriptional regulator [Streptomyces hydrogenans]|uniref:AraC family transcriptional regulator n=1 Tax=Streptomyces hydrogenans TaxID=1873719 RepID=UPI00365F6040